MDKPSEDQEAACWYYERRGVRHLDQLWNEQGKAYSEDMVLSRSTDLLNGSSYITEGNTGWMGTVNLYVQELLLPKVIATFPRQYYEDYRRTYRRATLNQIEDASPGIHTGHVIVQKQPIHQHRDSGDSGFCVTFCTGSFDGGYLVLADLGLVFLYRPGDILMFRSCALYHGVTTWLPRGDISPLGITPGRTAHVLYTKDCTVEYTKGKYPGWAWKTNVGKKADPNKDDFPEIVEEFPVPGSPVFEALWKKSLLHQTDSRPAHPINVAPHLQKRG
ncbi:hypothetical protein CPB86DRAFT_845750 [Serendipita vermifera]|nr:hypothetical protein CPB86DRAFT_845750 [Serendipita vermifera]